MDDVTPVSGEPMLDTRLSSINVEEEMKASYIDYSMSVIIGRSLPDARDGFKPVHRRVLYTMHEMDNVYNKPYKKSARIVGDTMGKYHPHGDSSIYGTLVRLAQDFSLRCPLVDGHGNFGSIDGDGAAAMRYTEVRMAKIANLMLDDIDKDTVDFQPNYDESETEPKILPAKLPNLLLNGSSGIAVGMATNIPPHNLRELCDATIHFIDNPECTIDDLMKFVKGPDFPTGATICGFSGIESMYKGTRGSIVMRGKAEITENNKRDAIIITEIPYGVNKAMMIEHMARLVNEKVIEGISDIRDESSQEGIRVVIELKTNSKPAPVILNQLYKNTELQTTFGANMLALDHGRPRRMTLKDFLQCYLDHRFEVITRRTKFELRKAEDRCHILQALLIVQDNIDEVIHIIRDSQDTAEAKQRLMERFGFSEPQVNAIVEMRLRQLTGLERAKIENELKELEERIAYLKSLLADDTLIYGVIKQDLEDIKRDFTKENDRRTEIIPMRGDVNLEDVIADEPCVITLSHRGYIKRVPLSTYKAQHRGGVGVRGLNIKDADYVERLFVAKSHDTLLFFTNTGRVYAERAFYIEEGSRVGFGKPIINVIEGLQKEESIVEILAIREFSEDQDIVFAMEDGTIKRTALSAYANVNRRGIIAITILEGNRLVQVALTKPGDDVIMASTSGMVIRFCINDVRRVGRSARGVRGMRLRGKDTVCAFATVLPGTMLIFATENGYGKRTACDRFRTRRRGGLGVMGISRDDKRNGQLVAVCATREDQTMIMMTSNGMMVRSPVNQVRICGRVARGVRFIKMPDGIKLVSFSIADREEDDETSEANENGSTIEVAADGSVVTTANTEPLDAADIDDADGDEPEDTEEEDASDEPTDE